MPFALFVVVTALIAVGTVVAAWRLSDRPLLAVGVGAIGAAGLLLLIGPGYFDCFIDDAFISYRYSEHLAAGEGPNWNSTDRVEGYTNFSMMGILAGISKLGGDIVAWAPVVGFVALLATFAGVYGIWRHLVERDPEAGYASPVVPVVAFVGLALTDGTSFWGFSGLETPLFMATITGGALFFMRERASGSLVPLSAVALAAAAMTRPEGVVAAGVTGAFVVYDVFRAQDREAAAVRAATWIAVFVALYGSYFLWRYSYYGYLLPNTFYAKAGAGTVELYERGFDYVWRFGLRYQLIALLGGAALLALRPRLRDDTAYALTLVGVMLAVVMYEGGDAFEHGRFILPLLPLIYILALAGFVTLFKRLALEPSMNTFAITGLLAVAGLSLYPGLQAQIPCRSAGDHEQRQVLGEWFSENAPEDFTIAAFAIGALGYYTEQDMLDLLGINDEHIARADVPNFGKGIAGHEKYDADYVYDNVRPEIIVPADAEGNAWSTEDLREAFAQPNAVQARNAILQDERLYRDYEVRSLFIPEHDYWFNFFQRKDTIDQLQAPELR